MLCKGKSIALIIAARRACCALIDYIANGLKSILSITEIKYEHVMARNNQNNEKKEARIQRQHRKLLKENINDYRQKQAKKININDCRSMRSVFLVCLLHKYFISPYFVAIRNDDLRKNDKRRQECGLIMQTVVNSREK